MGAAGRLVRLARLRVPWVERPVPKHKLDAVAVWDLELGQGRHHARAEGAVQVRELDDGHRRRGRACGEGASRENFEAPTPIFDGREASIGKRFYEGSWRASASSGSSKSTRLVRSSMNKAKRERMSLPNREGIGESRPGGGSRMVRLSGMAMLSRVSTASMVRVLDWPPTP